VLGNEEVTMTWSGTDWEIYSEKLEKVLEKARDVLYVIDGVHHTPAKISGMTSIHVRDDFIKDIKEALLMCEQVLKEVE
jgi:uncharacterized RmlC-like cupin family protein